MIPNVAVLEIDHPHFHMTRLWIPLILLWIPLVLLLLLLSPILLIVVCAISITTRVGPFRVVRVFWDILSSLRGTDVRVTATATKSWSASCSAKFRFTRSLIHSLTSSGEPHERKPPSDPGNVSRGQDHRG